MRQGEINLTFEVAQVHRELTAFRDQLLPALLVRAKLTSRTAPGTLPTGRPWS